MEKKAVSGIMLTLLLTGMLTLAFNIQPVKGSETIYIRPDGSVDPPTVPIERDGNVYTFISNIRDEIVVQRSNIIIDGNGYVLQGYERGWGFHLTDVRNVTIKRTGVKDFSWGIRLNVASCVEIFGNTITDNYLGIGAYHLSSSNIYGNNVTGNNAQGIFLAYSSNNTIHGNYIKNNEKTEPVDFEFAISLKSSSNNSIYGNYIANNDGDGVSLSSSHNNTVSGNDVSNNWDGIDLYSSSNNDMINNNLIGNLVELTGDSSHNIIANNNLTESGISLGGWGSVCYNIVQGNRVYDGDGIVLTASASSNIVYGNDVENSVYGISLIYYSSNNSVYRNELKSNRYGLRLFESSTNNIIRENNISHSENTGIHIERFSSLNKIYHNNFINNMRHAYSEENNVWDDGYPSGGNYWDDYEGEDKYCGPNQDQLGSDGIGDTAYSIEEYNWDRYPLMTPWTPTPPAPDFSITASPVSLTIQQGDSDTSVITITSISGFNQPVQLTVSGAPSDVTTTLNPEQVTPPSDSSATSTLTVSVDTTATPGSYTLTVSGTNGTLTHSVNISLEITTVPPPEQVSARIDSYSISPRNVAVGDDVTIGFIFTNTGNVSWTFGAGATLRKPDGTRIDFLEAVTVNLGESGSAQWTYTIDVAGRWDTVFGVWKESTHPIENLLVQTGWVAEYITATAAIENQPPIANIEPDLLYEVSSGKSVSLNGSNSYDPDGTVINYQWAFGDGETAEGRVVEHRFRGAMDQSKTYTVTLTVEDENGSTDTDTTYVTVRPLDKTIDIGGETLLHPGFAQMTAYYNWIGITEIDGQSEDIYIVSKIHFEGQRYISYVLSIWDSYSFSVGLPAWSRGLVYFGQPVEKNFVYPFGTRRDKTYTFDDGYFEGMAVGPSDVMRLWGFNVKIISGVAGSIYEGASASFDPGSITEPEEEVPNLEFVHLASPGELRVYDSQGRVTGLVNGEIKEGIPYSGYNNNTVLISFLSDSYHYEVAGTGEGSYNLTVTRIAEQKTNNFTATGIPASANAIHQYTIDWDALSLGEEGVTVQIDSDGDGAFEQTFTADSKLTKDEFMLQVRPVEAFPMWIVGVAVAAIAIATAGIAVFWRRQKQPPIKD